MKRFLLVLLLIPVLGCTSSQRASFNALGSSHRVTLYSGGKAIGSWHSRGKVHSSTQSDGYYFQDDESGKLIEVSGDVVIEQD